jgi:hypothetical protein
MIEMDGEWRVLYSVRVHIVRVYGFVGKENERNERMKLDEGMTEDENGRMVE